MSRKSKRSVVKGSVRKPKSKVYKKTMLALQYEMEAGRFEQALVYAEKLTDEYPDDSSAWEKLSNVHAKNNRLRDAVEAYKKCISTMEVSNFSAEFKLAQYQVLAGYSKDAIETLEVLSEKHSENKKVWQQLSRAYHDAGRNWEALEANDKVVNADPKNEEALFLRVHILDQLRRPSEAKKIALEVKKIAPERTRVSNYLASLELREGNYLEAEKYFDDEIYVNDSSMTAYNRLIARHYNPAATLEGLKKEADAWYEKYRYKGDFVRSSTEKTVKKKLRVGLLSGGFRTHPVGQMILPVLQNLDSTIFELIVYSTYQAEDDLTRKIKKAVDQWSLVTGLSDAELDNHIRNDQIDILIDMNGGGEGSRFIMLTREPAPLIVKWVGVLINTTGLKCFDYLLSDSVETPEGVDEEYSEKLIRLPNDYICYHIPDYAPQVNNLPALENGYITFGCLNNPAKFCEELIKEWSILLRDIPTSKLMLKNMQFEGEDFCNLMYKRFSKYGIPKDRLILEGPEKHPEFIKAYHKIDIALDTWPYSGGLTTCEALMMGVPVVTRVGPTFAGRHSATHLVNANLTELVTDNWEDYRQRVKELASDFASLTTIRSALRTIVKDSPLCDGKLFADHFTVAMRAIWKRHCEGKAPEALTMNKEGLAQFEDEDEPVMLENAEEISDYQGGDWSLDEPVIIVDNAALLPKHPRFSEFLQSGNMAMMSFDPGSQYTRQADGLKALGDWHHHPHALLGDGTQKTLYVTLDPEETGTLKPLSSDELPERNRKDLQLLTELPIDTLRLDDIEGLPSLDVLMLDHLNNPLDVLRNASVSLKETLVIQVRVAFHRTHQDQIDVYEILSYAHSNGFRFYCFNNESFLSLLPQSVPEESKQETEMLSADVILLPSFERMNKLTYTQRVKLAFLLHAVYGIKDKAYALLAGLDEQEAERYLISESFVPAEQDAAKPEYYPAAKDETISGELDKLLR